MAARPEVGELRVGLGERRRVHVRVHEDEPSERLHGDRHERELGRVEARLALGARRLAQAAVELVCPTVVLALERLAVPVLGRDREGTVAADVDESVQLAFQVSRQQHRDVRHPAHVVVAGVRDSRLVRDELPASREHVLELDVEDGRVGVPARRERHVPVERRLDCLRVDAELGRGRAHRVSASTVVDHAPA